MSLAQSRPDSPQKLRRILSLDGGGIRGVFTLQILARMELLLREATGNPKLVLADAFDMIAGTSTGAIIATMLSWGFEVKKIEECYLDEAEGMFEQTALLERWKSKYTKENITNYLMTTFSEKSEDGKETVLSTLGSKRLRTKLLLVMRNASTGSAWPLTNNPDAIFNDRSLPDCNLDVKLWQLVRASTAAPTFFPPEEITLGGKTYLCIDGGITPYNNPALIAFLSATLPCYRLNWPTGVDRLRIVSVGTGNSRVTLSKEKAENINLLDAAMHVIPALMHSISTDQDFLCRVLGHCEFGAAVNMEIGDLKGPKDGLEPPGERKFSYVRYDHRFTPDEEAALKLEGKSETIGLDNLLLINPLIEIGKKYAAESVRAEHLGIVP